MSVTDTLLAVPCCQGGAGRYHTLHRFSAERERKDNASTLNDEHRWTAKTQGDMSPYTALSHKTVHLSTFRTPTGDQSPYHQPLLFSTHLLPPPSLTYHSAPPTSPPSVTSLSPPTSPSHLAAIYVVRLSCVLALLHGGEDVVEQSMALPPFGSGSSSNHMHLQREGRWKEGERDQEGGQRWGEEVQAEASPAGSPYLPGGKGRVQGGVRCG